MTPEEVLKFAEQDGAEAWPNALMTALDLVIQDRNRLKEVIRQHDLCHDLHGKVNAEDFAKGCDAEQKRLYGCSPRLDQFNRALAALEQLRSDAEFADDGCVSCKAIEEAIQSVTNDRV